MLSSTKVVVFVDHSAIVGIAAATSLATSATDKLNPRIIRAAQYLSLYDLDIRHWPGRLHIIPDALSRLPAKNDSPSDTDVLEDVFSYLTTTVELSPAWRRELISAYNTDDFWSKVAATAGAEPSPGMPFILKDELLFFVDPLDGRERLCIPQTLEGDLFEQFYDRQDHQGGHRAHQAIAACYYVKNLARRLRLYISHCLPCQLIQTRRIRPYGELQPIQTPPIPFHTMCFDLVTALPEYDGYNAMMPVTDHFSKAVDAIPGRDDWTAEQWADGMYPVFLRWGIPQKSISDRDPKWLSALFCAAFKRQGTHMLFTTAYNP